MIADSIFLDTLPPRQRRAGLAEAVKVALIEDAGFFEMLWADRERLATLAPELLVPVIMRCAALHMKHIARGDPFESGSARPLDAGHWTAHALEEMTGGAILHGEAVAIGLALDALYAWGAGLLATAAKDRILHLLRDLGFYLSHPALVRMDAAEALERFREHMGGPLSITLPSGIGARTEVAALDLALVERSRKMLISLYPLQEVDDERGIGPAVGAGAAGPAFC